MMSSIKNPTGYPTEYKAVTVSDNDQNSNAIAKTTTTIAGGVFELFANAIDNIARNLSVHRLVFIIALIGYILIAFRGFMSDWASVMRYAVFIIFLLFLFSVIFFVKYYLEKIITNIERFFIIIIQFFTSKIGKFSLFVFLCVSVIYYVFLSVC